MPDAPGPDVPSHPAVPRSESGRHRLRVSLLGRRLDARLASPALIDWLERYWRYDEHAAEVHPYTIWIAEEYRSASESAFAEGRESTEESEFAGGTEFAEEPAFAEALRHGELSGPEWRPVEARLPDGLTLRGRRRGDVWRFDEGGGVVTARVDREAARVRVLPPVAGDDAVRGSFFAALYLCLGEALRASGLLPLHAAVVVRGEEAMALAAPSGTGKTTTLLRLMERGWHPLAEDLAWLDPDSLRIHGWDRGVRLWPNAIARLPTALREAAWRTDADGKRFLPWSELLPERRPAATLRSIVRLERGGEGRTTTTLTNPGASDLGFGNADLGEGSLALAAPLPPHEAVRLLWETMGVPLTDAARGLAHTAVPQLVRRVEFQRLVLAPFDHERAPVRNPS